MFAKGVVCAIVGLMLASNPSWGQSQSQFQYVYDAAGNLIQVTKSAVTPKPDLTISNLAVGVISLNGNGSFNIPVTFRVNNIGSSSALATWYDRGYLSANALLHDSDQALGGYSTRATNLAVGANYSVSTTFTTSTTTPAGNYTLIVKADGGAGTGQYSPTGANYVPESNETNNSQSIAINLPANPHPDLAISNASVGAITVSQGGAYNVPVTYTISNAGALSASPPWYDLVYLSADSALDNSDQNLLGYSTRNTALAPGASYTVTTTFITTPTTAPGSYTLFIKVDGHGATVGAGTNTDGGSLVEANEANNLRSLALTLPAKPDLAVSSAIVGAITVSQGGAYNVPVTYTISNAGALSASPPWYDLVYLSADSALDNSDQNLLGYSTRNTALAPGASYTVTTTFITTPTTAPGSYTLFIKVDGHGATVGAGTNTDGGSLVEANEANNIRSLALALPTKPDLVVSNVSVGTIVLNANSSKSIPVTYSVTNAGGAAAQPDWYDQAYLSADAVLDTADQNLSGYAYRSTALAAGASYTVTATFTTRTTTAPGNYTLFIKADGHGPTLGVGTNTDAGGIVESSESNNVVAVSVVLP